MVIRYNGRRYKRRSSAVIAWIENELVVPRGHGSGDPFPVYPFQRRILRRAFDGESSIVVVSLPRGNGKSTLLAAVVLAVAHLWERQQIVIAATTLKQAQAVYGRVLQMIEDTPRLAFGARIIRNVNDPHITFSNGSQIRPLAAVGDGASLMGLDPSLAVIDEAGFWKRDQFLAVTTSMGKHPGATTIAIGTPGYGTSENFMADLRLADQTDELPGLEYVEFAARPDRDVLDRREWMRANPAVGAGFLDPAVIATDAATLPESRFRTLRLGQWAGGLDAWIPLEVIDKIPTGEPPEPDSRISIGFDGSYGGAGPVDGTALIVCHGEPGSPTLWVAGHWFNPHPSGEEWRVPREEVLAAFEHLFETYLVERAYCDPFRWGVEIEQLQAYVGDRLLAYPTNQITRMLQPTHDLGAAITEGRLSWVPDQDLRDQFVGAVPEEHTGGIVIRKNRKRFPNRRDDLVIASILAHAAWQKSTSVPVPAVY